MSDKTITRIPVPSEILKGEWHGIVYAIETSLKSIEEHNAIVEESVKEIISNFDNNNHYTVSLREVKRELAFAEKRIPHHLTLVQFRVRDSY